MDILQIGCSLRLDAISVGVTGIYPVLRLVIVKRLVIFFGVLLVFITALFLMTPLFISPDTVKDRILSEAENLTGRKMTFRGNTSVSFLPFLGIEISDVVIEDPAAAPGSPPFIKIEKLLGKLDTLSAFFGRADIRSFRFIRPQFNFTTDGSGKANWVFEKGIFREVLDASAESLKIGEDAASKPAPIADIGHFEIVDGVANYSNTISGSEENFTNINGVVNWANTNSALQIELAGIWQGEQLKFSASAAEPIQLITGGNSEIEIQMQSAPVNFDFSGNANLISDIHLVGEFEMQSPSANRMMEFMRVTLLDGLAIGELEAAGKLEMKSNKAQLTEAAITLDGSRSVGSINISIDEKADPRLHGTLAFDAINITRLVEAVSNTTEIRAEAETPLRKLSLDLRVSSNTVSIYELEGEDFAAALSLRDGKFSLDVGNVNLFGGEIMAKIDAELAGEDSVFSININGSDANFDEIATSLGAKILQPSGKLDFKLDLNTTGTGRRSLLRNSTGLVEATARVGRINGIDLTLLRKTFSQEKTRSSFDELAGKTDYDALDFIFLINRGVAWISEGKLVTPDHEMALSGNFDILLGGLAVQAKIRNFEEAKEQEENASPEKPNPANEWNNFFIGGTFSYPLLTRWPTNNPSEAN